MPSESAPDHGRIYDRLSILMLLIVTLIGLCTWQDFGVAFDEGIHLTYGDLILEFVTTLGEDKGALT